MSHTAGETRAAVMTWVCAVVALLVAGPIVAIALGLSDTPTGLPSAGIATASSPAMGVIGAVVAGMVALVVGLLARLFLSDRYAVFSAGLVLCWYAGETGNTAALMREFEPGRLMTLFAVDGALLTVLGGGVAWVLSRKRSRPLPAHLHREPEPGRLLGGESAIALGLSAVGAIAGAYLVAVTGLGGQTLAAGIAGGFVAGLVCRVALQRAPMVSVVLGVGVGGVSAPLIGGMGLPAGGLAAIYGGDLFAPARLGPGDWLAGALVGVPVGQYAALGLLDRSHQKADAVQGRAAGSAGRTPASG